MQQVYNPRYDVPTITGLYKGELLVEGPYNVAVVNDDTCIGHITDYG